MFFFGCGDDTTLPESEMGKPPPEEKSPGEIAEYPSLPAHERPKVVIPPEPDLPQGQPAESLAERDGVYFLDGGQDPFTGVVERRHENGKLAFWGGYAAGKPNGAQHFWDVNGRKMQESNFMEGSLDGIQTFWWPNGKKKEERVWQKGKYRELRSWNNEGELIEENKNF